jgi:hypothetical protein
VATVSESPRRLNRGAILLACCPSRSGLRPPRPQHAERFFAASPGVNSRPPRRGSHDQAGSSQRINSREAGTRLEKVPIPTACSAGTLFSCF